MRSILLVCTANICRSPMAEGVLRKLLTDEGMLDKVAGRYRLTPRAINASQIASVPLPTPMACLVPL